MDITRKIERRWERCFDVAAQRAAQNDNGDEVICGMQDALYSNRKAIDPAACAGPAEPSPPKRAMNLRPLIWPPPRANIL
jgi:hypothetical protein